MSERQSKSIQDRHERILNELAKRPGNDLCADCGSKNPRWASHSLGVFLCIRCAGIHRKMGTHISKIKSITMDQWSSEQIDVMRNSGGNTAVNITINPSNQSIPLASDDDHSMEKYIRAKWEKRVFMAPKKTTHSNVQAPPKRSSSVPVHMQPKDDILVHTPTVQHRSPVTIHQQTNILTDEQKVEQLVRLGFTDRTMNSEALRRAGGNTDVAIAILNETKASASPVPANPFLANSSQLANSLLSPQRQQANTGYSSSQLDTNKSYNFQQQNFNAAYTSHNVANTEINLQQPGTPFNIQQSYTSSFTTQQKEPNYSFLNQNNMNTIQPMNNSYNSLGFSSNSFSTNVPFDNSIVSTSTFTTTPASSSNVFSQSAPSMPFQPSTSNNPFSQSNTAFNAQSQPMNPPFTNQLFSNIAPNPWATQTYFN
ncbi:putative GTPase activating protein for Arf-domain-containing protein [Sporodiniella umbellata]|nr:putative GTPase activating protein for Arf-domain-containing protein [Sporodiniella umbellata]